MSESERSAVERAVRMAFEIGKSKDLRSIQGMHLNDERFSKFGEMPPYTRMNFSEACMHEELFFASVSDYQFRLEDLRVDLFDDMAVATFLVEHSGMLVDDYSFRGQTMRSKSRGTMIFQKKGSEWLIVHEHFSKIP
ncbi:MAG: YybH family protein [Nitrososphaerales archaeon]